MTGSYLLYRLVALLVGIAVGNAWLRRHRRAQHELRQIRDDDQAALFRRPLPPRPGVVVSRGARVACATCRELVAVDALVTFEGDRICAPCRDRREPPPAETYRG